MSKRKKILILGVTGQDGSFMAKLMLEKNFIVHGMVRKSSTGNLGNIKELLNNSASYKPSHIVPPKSTLVPLIILPSFFHS